MEDINNIVADQIKEIISNDYHTIKMGDQECRLFKSLANRRLNELGETFDEYKLRLKINAKMLKQHKRESSRSNI
jgi:predicted house-cleaning noncanonical NTP pyrophosphatase (MazG superfamily)